MGKYINKRTMIDAETGEVVNEKKWFGYDGFNEKGYRYRAQASSIKYFFDSLPCNLSSNAWTLLMLIAEIMNDENVLVYKVSRKSKFCSTIYKPMDKDEIRQRLRFSWGMNKFNESWKELCKHCIKKIEYYNDMQVYAVNPAVIMKCKQVPFWLYEEFQDYMNPHLSATTIKKLQEKITYQD